MSWTVFSSAACTPSISSFDPDDTTASPTDSGDGESTTGSDGADDTTTGSVDPDDTSGGESSSGGSSSSSGDVEPFCGDGNLDRGEECDDGEANADDAACKSDCTAAFCGDGHVHRGVEECDDQNTDNSDGCTDMCIILEACGDGVVQEGEECDEGPANSDDAACLSDCQIATCGDGHVHIGVEQCDDGNEENNDACTVLCAPPTCGDGFVQTVLGELCDDGDLIDGDECNSDCFSAGLWTVTYNGPANNNDGAYGAAFDSANNVIVVGEVFDVVEGSNIWVRSYNGNGAENWTQTYHGVTSDNAYDVAVADNDDIFVVGSSFTLTDNRDTWLRRYAPDGTPGFIETANGSANASDEAFGVAIDPAGDVLVAGYITTTASGRDIWVRKYTAAGATVWTRTATSADSNSDEGRDVATDADGNVIVVGYIAGGASGRDIWVRKYDSDGNEQWTETYDGPAGVNDEADAVETDSAGNIIVAGFHNVGANGRDIWIRKYDPDGNEVWTQTYNAPQNGTDVAEAIGVDTDDNIIVGGSIFRGTQQDNVWVGKYDPDGNQIWVMEYNNSEAFQSDAVHGVAVDSEDNLAVVGFETRADIGEARNIWIRYILQ